MIRNLGEYQVRSRVYEGCDQKEILVARSRGGSDFAEQTARRVMGVTERAWRFAGEMEEISATFTEAGVPGGFHAAAATIYKRITHFKDAESTPALESVLTALIEDNEA